jgi:hypothetical protein
MTVVEDIGRFVGAAVRHSEHPVQQTFKATVTVALLAVCFTAVRKDAKFTLSVQRHIWSPWFFTCCYLLHSEIWSTSMFDGISLRQFIILGVTTLLAVFRVLRSLEGCGRDARKGGAPAVSVQQEAAPWYAAPLLLVDALVFFLGSIPLYFALCIHPLYGQRGVSWAVEGPLIVLLCVATGAHIIATMQLDTYLEPVQPMHPVHSAVHSPAQAHRACTATWSSVRPVPAGVCPICCKYRNRCDRNKCTWAVPRAMGHLSGRGNRRDLSRA